jgi:hypothetical protein
MWRRLSLGAVRADRHSPYRQHRRMSSPIAPSEPGVAIGDAVNARSVVVGAARGFGMVRNVVAAFVLVTSEGSDVYEHIGGTRSEDSAPDGARNRRPSLRRAFAGLGTYVDGFYLSQHPHLENIVTANTQPIATAYGMIYV